jgi:hypothetical protein
MAFRRPETRGYPGGSELRGEHHGDHQLLFLDQKKQKKMKAFFKEAWTRINSDTPTFFKKIGNVGTGIAASGTAIVTPEVVGAHMPDILVKIGAIMLTVGATMKGMSHLGSTDH